MTKDITFTDLCKREPRLAQLQAEIQRAEVSNTLRAWYGPNGYKQVLCELIGWDRNYSSTDTALYSQDAYEVAYHKLYDTLAKNDVQVGEK